MKSETAPMVATPMVAIHTSHAPLERSSEKTKKPRCILCIVRSALHATTMGPSATPDALIRTRAQLSSARLGSAQLLRAKSNPTAVAAFLSAWLGRAANSRFGCGCTRHIDGWKDADEARRRCERDPAELGRIGALRCTLQAGGSGYRALSCCRVKCGPL